MDLALYQRVLRRFWWVVAPGILLAFILAFLSLVRVSADGIAFRNPAVWQSQSLLLLTSKGFPYGQTSTSARAANRRKVLASGRLSALTELYAQLASSDEVVRLMRRNGASKTWKVVAQPMLPQQAGNALPVIGLAGQALSARNATRAAAYGREAFIRYVKRQQDDAGIPPDQRIEIQVLKTSTTPRPVVIKPLSKTLPIMVFLAVLSAAIGLAFVLENRISRAQVASRADDAAPLPGLPADIEEAREGEHDDLTRPALRDVPARRWG